jgi:hypothetical protein
MRNHIVSTLALASVALAASACQPKQTATPRPAPSIVGRFSGAVDQMQEAVVLGDYFAGVTCAGSTLGKAFCEADGSIVFCADDSWRAYTCDPGFVCGLEDDDVVMCFPKKEEAVDIEPVML